MRSTLLLIFVSLLFSCKNIAPSNHLSPDLMKKILKDINIAESYSLVVKDSLHKGGSKNIDSLAVYYKDIFAHYKITAAQFTESLNWYKENPDDLDSVYSDLMPA